mgnify:CR=1 FL=1
MQAADANGFSDPYAKLTFLRHSVSTDVVTKSLEPFWDETFEFKVGTGVVSEILENRNLVSHLFPP